VIIAVALAVLVAGPAAANPAGANPAATVVQRLATEEATQGVAVDDHYVYAVGDNVIGKYDKVSGRRVARFTGDLALYPHMNSCVVTAAELVCAASNYPSVPMASVVEVFDTATLAHKRTVPLPPMPGSLTWIERHDGAWWAALANYDGKGGDPTRDHRWTVLLRLDDQFRPVASWLFPLAVLDRFTPRSCSGGSWGDDGLLYVTGHDLPELYALRLPLAGTRLELVATIGLPTGGQAIAWEHGDKRRLWTIDRATKAAVASTIPAAATDR